MPPTNTSAEIVTLDSMANPIHLELNKLPASIACVHQKYRVVLEALLNVFFERADEAIFFAADTAAHQHLERQLFEVSHTLRAQKKTFIRAFLNHIDMSFSHFMSAQTHTQSPITTTSVTSDKHNRSGEVRALNHLMARIHSALAHRVTDQNIMSRPVLSAFFRTQIQHLALPPEALMCVKKAFNDIVLNSLEAVYEGLEQQLNAYNIPATDPTDKHFSGQQVAQLILQKKQENNRYCFDDVTASILQNTLKNNKKSQEITPKDQLRILDIAQRELAQTTTHHSGATIQLLTNIQSRLAIHGQISTRTLELIKLVNVMFAITTRHKNIDTIIKGYIHRLLIPTLKITMIDKSFFTTSQHPFRVLINEIVTFALDWQHSNDPKLNSPIIRCVDNITADICENFSSDIEIFTRALKKLRQQPRTVKQLSLLSTRLTASTQSKLTLQKIDTIVNSAIKEQIKQLKPPTIIVLFANTLWREVLTVCALNNGTQSTQWKQHIALLQRLSRLATPCTNTKEKINRAQQLPLIFIEIQQCLALCTHSVFDAAEMIEALNQTLRTCLAGQEAPKDFTLKNTQTAENPNPHNIEHAHTISSIPTLKNDNSITRTEQPSPVQAAPISSKISVDSSSSSTRLNTSTPHTPLHTDAEIEQQIFTFSRGMAFNWHEPGRGIIRCRLAAIIKQTNNYIFINRNGIKVVQLGMPGLVDAIKNGQMTTIENDNKIFNSALEEVVSGLRRDKTNNASTNH
ncbi:DUF1631 family protein [Marinagarivorans algicola]|uniref:DUF1631 family protein n=1 Tax=Marinagarivorans algicola TaxID=1513270 RepID=UPI0012E1FCEB|nr:DUF1631 family protein [Marinagarivorans algicola]